MTVVEFDDPALLARLRSSDEAAFRQLVRRFHGALVAPRRRSSAAARRPRR